MPGVAWSLSQHAEARITQGSSCDGHFYNKFCKILLIQSWFLCCQGKNANYESQDGKKLLFNLLYAPVLGKPQF